MLYQGTKSTVVASQTMENLKSQSIVGDRNTKIVKRSSNILKFITISLHIRESSKRNIIELRLKVKNTRGFVTLKIVLNASPSIKSTIIGTDNQFKKGGTKSTINPCTNNVIKTFPIEVFGDRCFRRVIGNDMRIYKISRTM